ncbi:MAG: universal stress protein [Salinibacter sp.]|uniref:universal stress protein n=1 Tax=Salinibacter sp. TaxID=2065818 RepID=UPI0035D501AF
MLNIRRILWPTDLTDQAERAFPHAATLAAWHDADLHILNVVEKGTGKSAGTKETFPVPEATLTGFLRRHEAPPQSVNLEALTVVQDQERGESPPDAITAYVDGHDIDLVVMGTHGRRGLRHLFIGSVAEGVVRRASCPVLTVREGSELAPAWRIRNILVPVDFSEASLEALRHAKELALTYGAQITLLHVVEEVVYPSAYGLDPVNLPGAEVVTRVEENLAEIARDEIGYEHVEVEANVGYAPSSIHDYAETNDADLITIATHGRTGLERMLLGSVAERVVRQAPTPVFVVKSFGKSLLPPSAEASS